MEKNQKMNYLEKLIVFLVVFFKYLITYGSFESYLYVYLAFLVVLVMIDIISKRIYYISEIRNILILGIITCYFILFYSEQNFLVSFLLAMICLKRDNRSFIKSFFYSSIICYILTLSLNMMGILESNNMIRIEDGALIVRYSLGFSHPNEVFLFFLPIVLSGFYLYSDKKLYYITVFIISVILYKFSDCRTGFYVIIIFLLFCILKKIFTQKITKRIIQILILILTLFTLLIAIKYGTNLNNSVSNILSGRPYYWNYYINSGKILSFFGHNKIEGMYVDNFYMYMLVQLGLVGYIIYTIIYYISIKRLNFDYKYLIIITMFLIYGLFEANVIIGSIQFLFAIQLKSLIENKNMKEEDTDKIYAKREIRTKEAIDGK